MYPCFVVLLAVFIVIVMLVFVFPVFKEMFDSMGMQLPAITRILMNMGLWMKKNWYAILGGITCGVLSNLAFIFAMCILFKIGHNEYVSLLPKSITTAIALALTDEFHGFVPITVMMVIITGNLGNLFAPQFCKIFHIKDPVARGVAIGTSSHALGTAKAIEMGEIEGAMSGLSIAVTGLLTVVFASIFAPLI